LSPANLGPEASRHPGDRVHGIRAKLSGRGCDDLHWSTGPGSAADNHVTGAPGPARPGPERPGDLAGPGARPRDLAKPSDAWRNDGPAPSAAGPGALARPIYARPADLIPPGAAWPGDRGATEAGGLGDPTRGSAAVSGAARPGAARRHGGGRLGTARAELPGSRAAGTPRQRRGWYAYWVVGPAKVPPWAAEIALTIERPANPDRGGAGDRTRAAARSGSTGSRGPKAGARPGRQGPPELGSPAPMLEPAGAPAPGWAGGQVQAMVLFRAPGRTKWLAGIAEAAMEVEAALGIRPVAGVDALAGVRAGIGSRLLAGPALPGLLPVAPAVAQASLAVAGTRGLPAPMRRWRPPVGGMDLSWRPSAGSVVTCEGPCGISAQAVVGLRGLGIVAALAPPPGGALVLRAWQTRGRWGAAFGLVLGAAETLGLGREAGCIAARARSEGWDAVVLSGSAALDLARAGSPGQAAPVAAAQAASGALVAALFEACLAAGGLGGAAGPQWSLAVTP
jgi:hypothetical protein